MEDDKVSISHIPIPEPVVLWNFLDEKIIKDEKQTEEQHSMKLARLMRSRSCENNSVMAATVGNQWQLLRENQRWYQSCISENIKEERIFWPMKERNWKMRICRKYSKKVDLCDGQICHKTMICKFHQKFRFLTHPHLWLCPKQMIRRRIGSF